MTGKLAEVDGNRTRLAELLGHVGFEDRGDHQAPSHLPGGKVMTPICYSSILLDTLLVIVAVRLHLLCHDGFRYTEVRILSRSPGSKS